MHYVGDLTVTHRRLPPPRHILTLPYKGTADGCFLGRSICSVELSPLTSYFQSPTPSSYRQPTRSLRCPRDLFDPRGTSPVSKTEDVSATREKHLLPRFGARRFSAEQKRGEHTGCMFQREEYADDQRYIPLYNVDFTCKSKRITKATRRLYLI